MAGRINYFGNIVSDGLIQYLDFARIPSYIKTGTTVFDLSGYGNHATLINGPVFSNFGLGSEVLDGINDKIQLSTNNLNGMVYNIQWDIDWTIETWMYQRPFSATPNTYKMIYGNYSGCNYNVYKGNGQGIIIYSTTNSAATSINLSFGPRNVVSGSACPDVAVSWTTAEVSAVVQGLQNRWAHVVFTSSDGTNYRFFVDGVQYGTTKTVNFKTSLCRSDNQLTSTSPYTWGNEGPANNAANGVNFSICRLYNKALTPTQVLQNYNAGKNRYL